LVCCFYFELVIDRTRARLLRYGLDRVQLLMILHGSAQSYLPIAGNDLDVLGFGRELIIPDERSPNPSCDVDIGIVGPLIARR
jgi:hypothetical protein